MKNKTAGHTPGPWNLGTCANSGKGLAVCQDSRVIAVVNGNGYPIGIGNDPESTATARLIAAAPELLKACYLAAVRLESKHIDDLDNSSIARILRHAISKAEEGI